MRSRSRPLEQPEDLNIWQAYTDLMSNAFMIISLFLLIALIKSILIRSELTAEIERLKNAPPVLIIQNSGEYQFASGQATLPPALRSYIWNNLADQIEQITKDRNIYVVEIIGHTDGQATGSQSSNLDQMLENVAVGQASVSSLNAGSNADLGLMRSLEVVRQLQYIQKQGRLQGLQFRAYSAAQLLQPSGEFATANRNPDATRRRIEIRFSPLGDARTINY
jgi:outer membrane protein OmpA-like peptidoglycan-associated protein